MVAKLLLLCAVPPDCVLEHAASRGSLGNRNQLPLSFNTQLFASYRIEEQSCVIASSLEKKNP